MSVRPVAPSFAVPAPTRPVVAAPRRAPAPAPAPALKVTGAGPLSGLAWIARALWTGREVLLPGHQAPYPGLDPAARAAAIRRGAGRVVAQPLTTGDAGGTDREEPVNIVVTGSWASLQGALARAGWTHAASRTPWHYARQGLSALFGWGDYPRGPVSQQFLAGHGEVAAYSKNSDHNRARDHLRVYATSPDPRTGAPRWAIAASRDVAASLSVPRHGLHFGPVDIGHATDPHLDRERDLVMHDLLATGAVARWAAVTGRRAPGLDRPGPDGFIVADRFHTDGRVYEVDLR